MTTQLEQALEDSLVKQLIDLGYEYVQIRDESDLLTNLKAQLEKHNKVDISDSGFEQILNHLNKGNVFDRAKILRDKVRYKKTSGEIIWLEFLDVANWCQNQFQVTRQISAEGRTKIATTLRS